MAIDNLNYYSSWLPAWQQTDKYSSQPWCLKSKNLDIFSSSKSVKATAFSTPVDVSLSGVTLVDQTWNLILKNDNVYDISSWNEVLIYTWVAANFPAYQVSYNWQTGTYANAQRWTPKQIISKYENWVLKYFTIFTDKSRFSYSTVEYKTEEETWSSSEWTKNWSYWNKSSSSKSTKLSLRLPDLRWMTNVTLYADAFNANYDTQWWLTIKHIYFNKPKYWYNAETDQMEYRTDETTEEITIVDQLNAQTDKTAANPIPAIPDTWEACIDFWVEVVPPAWSSDYSWTSWRLDLRVWSYQSYYNYLPVNDNRYLKDIWEYYWEKGISFQPIYNWNSEWTNGTNYERVVRYSLDKYMWWISDVSMDVVSMIIWNEQVYMVWNMNGNWYIIPCDLTGWRWTPYIAYGCEFKWATNIDYLLYLVWEDRGISCLWVYNWQELVKAIGGNKEKNTSDIIDWDEQYKFDWKIINWRKNLILSTSDNRIFQYWQTYGGKAWSFIHQIPSNAVISDLKTNWDNLEIYYSITDNWTTTNYKIIYQDDVAVKNYNTEWVAVYPMVLWNHLLEKEESDLYVSYIIPSDKTKLEFWACVNHYHFWTFKMAPWTQAPAVWSTWEIDWIGNPRSIFQLQLDNVEFIEANGDYFTFRVVWELPVLSGNETWRLKQRSIKEGTVYMNYTEVHHFRKIWEITAGWFEEWEFRFTNLNNKLELPKAHSLQIMVKGIGTSQFTPELFSLDLVANQRERW